MTRMMLLICIPAAMAVLGCAEPDPRLMGPATLQNPVESPGLFAAAVDHMVRDSRGRVLVDPRPLPAGADMMRVREADLLADAEAVTRMRAEVLSARGITQTDATLDQRCTFSDGIGLPPGREAMLPDSVRRQAAACRAREAYTSYIFSIPEPVQGDGYPARTWRVRVHAMDKAGFQVWDLYLRPTAQAEWEVIASERGFSIQS